MPKPLGPVPPAYHIQFARTKKSPFPRAVKRQNSSKSYLFQELTPSTQATYLEAVKVLARHYNRRLDEITQEQVRDFLLYLIDSKGYAKSTYKVYMYAIKFLYQNTLGRQWRFLQHVLPAGVHKVRYYGLWSPSNRKKLLKMQQTLTQSGNDQPEGLEEDMDAEISPSSEPRQCPHCQKGTLVRIGGAYLAKGGHHRERAYLDLIDNQV